MSFGSGLSTAPLGGGTIPFSSVATEFEEVEFVVTCGFACDASFTSTSDVPSLYIALGFGADAEILSNGQSDGVTRPTGWFEDNAATGVWVPDQAL